MAISKGMVFYGSDASTVWALAGICGDVNWDGSVTPGDIARLRAHLAHGASLCSKWASDVNCDCTVTPGDIARLRAHLAHGASLGCCGT